MPSITTLQTLLRRKKRQTAEPRRRPVADEEHQHQAALINRAALVPMPRAVDVETGAKVLDYIFAIANGGKRSKATAVRLLEEGLKAGVWDLMVPLARGGHHGLWIEMKSATGALSVEQKRWGARMRLAGYRTEVCRSCDEAWSVLENYLGL